MNPPKIRGCANRSAGGTSIEVCYLMKTNTACLKTLAMLSATCLLTALPLHSLVAAEGEPAPKPGNSRSLDMAELQPLVTGGKAADALKELEAALEKDPDNALDDRPSRSAMSQRPSKSNCPTGPHFASA